MREVPSRLAGELRTNDKEFPVEKEGNDLPPGLSSSISNISLASAH